MKCKLAYIGLALCAVVCSVEVGQAQSPNQYAIATFAGNFAPGDGEAAANALLSGPLGTATDKAGNIYFIDQRNSSVRKISTTGIISTIALVPGAFDLAFDRANGVIVVATDSAVFRVTTSGQTTRIAGGRDIGSTGDGGPAVNAVVAPYAISVDSKGVIYVAEAFFDRVRRIGTDGVITTFAGTGNYGFSGDGGPAKQAQVDFPTGVAIDVDGFVYISDYFNGRLRRVTPAGTISTFAGNGFLGQPADGVVGPATRFGGFGNLSIDDAGNVLICDPYWNMVFRITNTGSVRVLAGTGVPGFSGDGATGRAALLDGPYGVAALADGSVIIADANNDRIRKVAADGKISTISGKNHFAGDDGQAVQATLNRPSAIARDSKGLLYISDRANNRIRRVDADGTIHTVVGSARRGYDGDGGAATSPKLNAPLQLVFAPDDTLFFIDYGNLRIRAVSPAGTITTFAGTGEKGDSGDNGPATAAKFQSLTGLAVDRRGNLFVADGVAGKIRRIDIASGVIYPFAGNSTSATSGEGGQAMAAKLGYPADMVADARNTLYVVEVSNGIIRQIETSGIITTVAGDGSFGPPVEGAPAKQTGVGLPTGLAFDSAGNLLLTSLIPERVYSISPQGTIRTVAGAGPPDQLGDGGPALFASLSVPLGIVTDSTDNLYVADTGNDRVRKLSLNNPAKLEITGGNHQQGSPGQPAPELLRVKLTGSTNVVIPGALVSFQVISGSASLPSPTAVTDAAGIAGMAVTFGLVAGPVRVEASIAGLPAATFDLTVGPGTGGGGGLPTVSSVTLPVDYGGNTTIASGAWLEIKGANLAAETKEWTLADFNGDTAPTVLAGVRVKINGQPAFIRSVSPTQIVAQAPAGIPAGTAAVEVTTAAGTNTPFSVASASRAPALLAPSSFLVGGRQYLEGVFNDGTYVGRPGTVPGVSFRLLEGGDRFLMFGVGFGNVAPALAPGQIARVASVLPNVTAKIGGVNAPVEYAGLASGYVGLYQFNLVAPPGFSGDQRVELFIDGVALDSFFGGAQPHWITYDSAISASGLQMNDGLQMRGLREQVRQRQTLDRITVRE